MAAMGQIEQFPQTSPTKTLLGRRWTTKAWLVCVLDYKGRHREVMGGRSWTELFFLDEAVALAAGHRPCFFCRRAAAEAFRTAWGKAKGGKAPLAPEMDAVLHEERLDRGRKRVHAISDPVAELPDGAVVVAAGAAYTVKCRNGVVQAFRCRVRERGILRSGRRPWRARGGRARDHRR